MTKKVYPLQDEIQKDLLESSETLGATYTRSNFVSLLEYRELAQNYYNAIKRINEICVNRKRY